MPEIEMEMETVDDILRKSALDGSMDYSAWPDLLPTVLARIEKIAHTEFPIPAIPPPQPAQPPSPRFLAPLPSSDPFEAPDPTDSPSSQGTDKENADPSSPSAARNAGASTTAAPAARPPSQLQPAALPKPVADMLDEILSVLRTNFSQYPPHTIQRLSELVLRPRQHYRNLIPYLHALDRVVHVTSGANIYPLPPALPDVGAMSLLANGVGGSGADRLSIDTAAANNLASDEALGGALLTPIPWLTRRANGGGSDDEGSDAGSSSPLSASGNTTQQFQLQQQQQQRQAGHLEGTVRTESTETIEGPNGIGSIETVSVSVNGIPSTGAGVALLTQRSVTQGELLRQEQRAGLVPLNQLNRQQQQQQQQQAQGAASGTAEDDATMTEGAGDEAEDEIPHARGPEEIGPADTGPQSAATASLIAGGGSPMHLQGIDVEAAVGRRMQSPPTQQQQQQQETVSGSSPGGGGGDLIPRSPKREAADSLEPESPAKRRREDEAASQGQIPPTAREEKENKSADDTPSPGETIPERPKTDAEGDVDLSDAAAEPASTENTQARQTPPDAAPDDPKTPEKAKPTSSTSADRDGVEAIKDGTKRETEGGEGKGPKVEKDPLTKPADAAELDAGNQGG